VRRRLLLPAKEVSDARVGIAAYGSAAGEPSAWKAGSRILRLWDSLRSSRALLEKLAHKWRATCDDGSVATHAVEGGDTLAIDKAHADEIKREAAALFLALFVCALKYGKVGLGHSAFELKGRVDGVLIAAGDLEHRPS
jgi:hypothetical protein